MTLVLLTISAWWHLLDAPELSALIAPIKMRLERKPSDHRRRTRWAMPWLDLFRHHLLINDSGRPNL
jgi:hypothetical protein